MHIYLAAPLFTSAERLFNKALAVALRERGHSVYLPQEAAGQGDDVSFIFDACLRGIEQCDVVLANMDGPDPDSGTCFECGRAFGMRKLLLFRTDFRNVGDHVETRFNLMLAEAADGLFYVPLAAPEAVAAEVHAWMAERGLR